MSNNHDYAHHAISCLTIYCSAILSQALLACRRMNDSSNCEREMYIPPQALCVGHKKNRIIMTDYCTDGIICIVQEMG